MRLLPPCIDTLRAGYSLEMEHPGSGHRAVETFAAMPAVVARAAELIQAGYTIGIWSPATFEGRLNMSDGPDATQEGSPLVAADLCATLLANGGIYGRFAMSMDELAGTAGHPRAEVDAAIAWAVEHAWLRHDGLNVELRAAGIHVAKQTLELPRQVS
jgi:hypothetical protein